MWYYDKLILCSLGLEMNNMYYVVSADAAWEAVEEKYAF